MCNYIKDNGEQCGREADPFCHDHEDTRFAALWHRSEASDSAVSGFSPPEGVTTCDRCETAVRAICGDLSPAAFQPGSTVVTLVLACECLTREWYPNDTLASEEVPDQWMTE